MRIDRLDLAAFGHFTDHVLDFGAPPAAGTPDLHLVYGPNEAGKSTTLAAVAELLHGMPHRSSWAFVHDNATLEIGARLSVGGEALEVRRFKNRLTDADGRALGERAIDVHGLSEAEYRARFSLDEKTIEKGSDEILSQQGELGAALFSAAAGLADLGERLERAMASADAFWQPRKRVGLALFELRKELETLDAEIAGRDTDAAAWSAMRTSTEAARAAHAQQADLVADLQAKHGALARQQATASAAARRRELLARIAVLEPLVELDVTGLDALEIDLAAWTGARAELDATNARLAEDVAGLDRLVPDERALLHADAIEALSAERVIVADRRRGEAGDRQALEASLRRCGALTRELDIPADTVLLDAAPSDATLAALEGLALERTGLVAAREGCVRELERCVERARAAGLDVTGTAAGSTSGPGAALDPDPVPESVTGDAPADALLLSRLLDQLVERAPQVGLAGLARRRDESALTVARALEALAPWHGDAGTLARQGAPEPAEIAALEARSAELAGRARDLEREERLLREARAANADALAGLVDDEIVDDEALARLRASRDGLMDAHRASVVGGGARVALERELDDIESLLATLDVAADARVSHGDALARLRGLRSETAALERRSCLLGAERDAVEADAALLASDVERVAARTGLSGASLVAITAWLPRRTAALERVEELREAEAALGAADADTRAQAVRVAMLLTPLLPATSPEALAASPLEELLPLAKERVDEVARAGEARERVARERAMLRTELESRGTDLAAADAGLTRWHERWSTALDGTAGLDVDPDSAITRLPRLRELGKEARAAADRESAVRALDAALKGFAGRAASLGAALAGVGGAGNDGADRTGDPAAIVVTLERRLSAARRVQDAAGTLRERVVVATGRRDAAREAIAPLAARLEGVRVRCDAPDIDALRLVAERLRERRDLRDRLGEVEAGLREALQADDVAAALADETPRDRDELAAELALLDARLADENRELSERLVAYRTGERDLADLDGGTAVAALQARRAGVLHEIESRAVDTLRSRLGRLALEAGLNRFREQHRSGMMEHARRAFVALTDGQFSDLRARPDDRGRERLLGVRADGGTLDAARMSTGTRFQLFLALRVAAWHEYADERTPLPFVADDILESFDERRTAAAFEQMRDMARRGQVIYLTHHRHLLDLARETLGDVRVHELPARGTAS